MIDIFAWSFTDWFTFVVLAAVALNALAFGLAFLVENREALRYRAEARKAEREARPKPRKDPKYETVSDWAAERLFRATEVEGE